MYKNPCKPDCPDRSPTCHAECPKYAAYDILNDIFRDQIYREKQTQNDCFQSSRIYRDKRKKRPFMDRRDAQ